MSFAELLDFDLLSIIGTSAFAVSGYLLGVRKHFDLLGISIVAALPAIGGGIIRDVVVDRIPLSFTDNTNLFVILATLAVALLIRLHKHDNQVLNTLFIVADSIGLVAFSLGGAQVGLEAGLNAFGVVSLGFITAVGGGIVRDMMVNDVPFILHQDFYGTVSILVAGALYGLNHFGLANAWAIHALFLAGLALRLLAHWSELSLPKVGKHH